MRDRSVLRCPSRLMTLLGMMLLLPGCPRGPVEPVVSGAVEEDEPVDEPTGPLRLEIRIAETHVAPGDYEIGVYVGDHWGPFSREVTVESNRIPVRIE